MLWCCGLHFQFYWMWPKNVCYSPNWDSSHPVADWEPYIWGDSTVLIFALPWQPPWNQKMFIEEVLLFIWHTSHHGILGSVPEGVPFQVPTTTRSAKLDSAKHHLCSNWGLGLLDLPMYLLYSYASEASSEEAVLESKLHMAVSIMPKMFVIFCPLLKLPCMYHQQWHHSVLLWNFLLLHP